MHLPWRFDETYRVPLTVRHALDLNARADALEPYQRQLTRVVGLINARPVTLFVFVPRSGCATGDRLPVQVLVTNRSRTTVEKVKFTLQQICEYHSTSPARYMRTEMVRVLRKEAGGVERNGEQRYEHMLEIPEALVATRTGNGILNIRYELQIEAKLAGLYKNLQLSMPFIVATLPYFSSDNEEAGDARQPAQLLPAQPQSNGARFTPVIGWRPPLESRTPTNDAASTMTLNEPNRASYPDANITPTPSAYPSLQSLPNVPYTPPYTPPSFHNAPPNYAYATGPSNHMMSASMSAMPPYNPHFHPAAHRASMRSERYVPPTAPPLDFVTPPGSGSTRSSICSSNMMVPPQQQHHHQHQRQVVWDSSPPSYDDVYGAAGGAAAISSSSSTLSSVATSRSGSPARYASSRRKQQAPALPV